MEKTLEEARKTHERTKEAIVDKTNRLEQIQSQTASLSSTIALLEEKSQNLKKAHQEVSPVLLTRVHD